MIQALDLNGHLEQRNKLTEALWILALANGSKVAFQAFLMWAKEQTRLVCETSQFWSPYIIFAFIWIEDFQNAYNVLKFWCTTLPGIEHVREMSHQLHPWGYLSMINQPHSSQFQGLCSTKKLQKKRFKTCHIFGKPKYFFCFSFCSTVDFYLMPWSMSL